jgi:hypothetical protein
LHLTSLRSAAGNWSVRSSCCSSDISIFRSVTEFYALSTGTTDSLLLERISSRVEFYWSSASVVLIFSKPRSTNNCFKYNVNWIQRVVRTHGRYISENVKIYKLLGLRKSQESFGRLSSKRASKDYNFLSEVFWYQPTYDDHDDMEWLKEIVFWILKPPILNVLRFYDYFIIYDYFIEVY